MEGHATQEWGQGSSRPPPQPQQHCHCPCLDLLCKLPTLSAPQVSGASKASRKQW